MKISERHSEIFMINTYTYGRKITASNLTTSMTHAHIQVGAEISVGANPIARQCILLSLCVYSCYFFMVLFFLPRWRVINKQKGRLSSWKNFSRLSHFMWDSQISVRHTIYWFFHQNANSVHSLVLYKNLNNVFKLFASFIICEILFFYI